MKKFIITAFGLCSIITFAQSNNDQNYHGHVGINTNKPKATLEIIPNADNSVIDAQTNEGLLIPKLSKERIANIKDEQLIEGTLVYVINTTYTGTNNKVNKINEIGFYYYNGTEWIKGFIGPKGDKGDKGDKGEQGMSTSYTDSNSIIVSGNQLHRAELTGDITAPANSNTMTISPNAITSSKIADGQVMNIDLADNAVTGTKIANATITANKLAPNTVKNIYNADGTLVGKRTIHTNGNDIVLIGGGKMGLGTDSPITKLHVQGNARITELPQGNTSDRIVVADGEGNLKQLSANEFKNLTYANVETHGIYDALTTIRCNHMNLGSLYLLQEGTLLCDIETHTQQPHWFYIGAMYGTRLVGNFQPYLEKVSFTRYAFTTPNDNELEFDSRKSKVNYINSNSNPPNDPKSYPIYKTFPVQRFILYTNSIGEHTYANSIKINFTSAVKIK